MAKRESTDEPGSGFVQESTTVNMSNNRRVKGAVKTGIGALRLTGAYFLGPLSLMVFLIGMISSAVFYGMPVATFEDLCFVLMGPALFVLGLLGMIGTVVLFWRGTRNVVCGTVDLVKGERARMPTDQTADQDQPI